MAPSEDRSQVELLHQISNIVSSNLSLERMLQELVGMAVTVTGCDACLVYLVDHASHEIVLRASQLPHAPEIGNIRMKMGEGITGWVAQHKSVVALRRTQPLTRGSRPSRRCRKTPTRPFYRCR